MPNDNMSTVSIVARALLIMAGFFLLAWLCSACAAPVADAPEQMLSAQSIQTYTSCTTVTDTAPNEDCGAGQTDVTRCTNAIQNPDTDQCTGPAQDQGQALGVVWCCKPKPSCTIDANADAVAICGATNRYVMQCNAPIAAFAVECNVPPRGTSPSSVWCCG